MTSQNLVDRVNVVALLPHLTLDLERCHAGQRTELDRKSRCCGRGQVPYPLGKIDRRFSQTTVCAGKAWWSGVGSNRRPSDSQDPGGAPGWHPMPKSRGRPSGGATMVTYRLEAPVGAGTGGGRHL